MDNSKLTINEKIDKIERLAKKKLLEKNNLTNRLHQLDNSKKFIVGSAVLSHIEKSKEFSNELLQILQNEIRGDLELRKIADVLEQLKTP